MSVSSYAHRAYIGLGSNLANPPEQIERALRHLGQCPGVQLLRRSKQYQNPAVADEPQPDYRNAVALLATRLNPRQLLATLHATEKKQGRLRDPNAKGAARTLDLDLLLFDKLVIEQKDLTVPHPRMLQRDFVLLPLLEIAPDLILPDGRMAREYLARLESRTIAHAEHLEPLALQPNFDNG